MAEESNVIVAEPSYSRRDVAQAQQAQPTSLIQAIAAAASDPRIDMDRAERLFRMQREMVRDEAKAAYHAAMSRAQARII